MQVGISFLWVVSLPWSCLYGSLEVLLIFLQIPYFSCLVTIIWNFNFDPSEVLCSMLNWCIKYRPEWYNIAFRKIVLIVFLMWEPKRRKQGTFTAFFTVLYLSCFTLKVFQTKPLVLKYISSIIFSIVSIFRTM